MKVVIHLSRRSPAASSDALNLFQREQTVRRGSLVPNSQLLCAMLQNLFATSNQATDVGADLHIKFSAGLSSQHRVIADHVAHFEFRQIQTSCKFRNHFVAEKSNF